MTKRNGATHSPTVLDVLTRKCSRPPRMARRFDELARALPNVIRTIRQCGVNVEETAESIRRFRETYKRYK